MYCLLYCLLNCLLHCPLNCLWPRVGNYLLTIAIAPCHSLVDPIGKQYWAGSWACSWAEPGPGPACACWGGNQGGGWGAWGLGKATYSQAKLPTVKQSYLLSGKATYVRQAKDRCQAKQRQSGMHPRVSAYMHPTAAYFAPKRFRIHAPKIRTHAPKSFCIHAFNSACIHLIPHAY